jgi:serine/threonine protein kinase
MDVFSKDPNRYRWVGKIGAQVADALGYSHEMGMLHRDIKPANLMLDDKGQVWITDFGLVKLSDEEQLTQTGAVLGTPQYLAPESLKGMPRAHMQKFSIELSTKLPIHRRRSIHRSRVTFRRLSRKRSARIRKIDTTMRLHCAMISEHSSKTGRFLQGRFR